jgi:hypothetical protein
MHCHAITSKYAPLHVWRMFAWMAAAVAVLLSSGFRYFYVCFREWKNFLVVIPEFGILKIKKYLYLIVLCLFFHPPAYAGLNEGFVAYSAKNYAQALKEFGPLAQQGNARAQYALGVMYYNGQGMPQDYMQAAEWFRKAAEQGDIISQYSLGVMYDNGQGVPQHYLQAAAWYRKAAEQRYADAQTNLGVMYAFGQGVYQNNVIAYALYNLSASIAPTDDSLASNNRSSLVNNMTPSEIAAGQALTLEISKPGNLTKALEKYLMHPAVKYVRMVCGPSSNCEYFPR